jgi:nucleotide-binding universal stress UspA family protein
MRKQVPKPPAAKTVAELDEAAQEVDVTTRARDEKVRDAVIDEARKGFDLLVVGMEKVIGTRDSFDTKIEELTSGFEGRSASSRRKASI